MNNLHWSITATDKITPKDDEYRIHYAVNIMVKHLVTEEEAINRAKEIINRQHYILSSVFECDCVQHNLQHRRILETTKDLAKAIKKTLGTDENNE